MTTNKSDKVFRLAVKGKEAEPSGSSIELLPRHWFYAAVTASGEICKKDADSMTGLPEICASAAVAWVDCWMEDFEKDAPSAANQFGFRPLLVSSLIGEYASTYQDLDMESLPLSPRRCVFLLAIRFA